MKSQYFIIAGPQAAGKTTTIGFLNKKYNCYLGNKFHFFEESRKIVNDKYDIGGAVEKKKNDERDVIALDIKKMLKIKERLNLGEEKIYVDESNIFNLAHASMRGIFTENYFMDYCSLLDKLSAKIIFLDVQPGLSWQRRKEIYAKRLEGLNPKEQRKLMKEYKKYLEEVYPNLLKLYEMLHFPKLKLDSSILSDNSINIKLNTFKNFMRN